MEQEVTLPQMSIEEALAEFLPSFQAPFATAPFLGQIYEWASKNVELPYGYNPPGLFDVSLSPYLIDPFKAIKDPCIRQVCLMAPPRSGKTLWAEIVLLFLIANCPGNILWIQATEKAKNKMGDSRMAKLLKLCPPVAKLLDPNDRYAVTQNRYRFTNGVEVHLASATPKSLQSFGYKYIVFDEVWLADPGLIAEAQARVGDFENTHKIILISQGGDLQKNPEWELEFNKGIVKEYGFTCPKCKVPGLYLFNHRLKDKEWVGLVWERNAKSYVDGEWVIEEAAKTAVLKCSNPACLHCITDTPENREYLFKHSAYITTKDKGDTTKASFRYNSLCSPQIAFGKLCKEWLEADRIQETTGESLAKDIFRRKRLAETPGRQKQLELLELSTLILEEGKEWKPNAVRFLTVDVQRKAPRFWYVCREWTKDGESRKVAHGSCHSWAELEELRKKLNVKWHRVFVDAGDGQYDDEVFTQCTVVGAWANFQGRKYWFCYNACKGFDNWTFKENGNKPYKLEPVIKVNLPQSPQFKGVRGCSFFKWSNPRIKKILTHLRDGKGVKWLSNDVDPEYQKQMVSEIPMPHKGGIRYVKVNENERNEYWDCEALQILAALHYNLLSVTAKGEEEEEEKPGSFVKS